MISHIFPIPRIIIVGALFLQMGLFFEIVSSEEKHVHLFISSESEQQLEFPVSTPGTDSRHPENDWLHGAIDLHCHTGPDTIERSLDDIELMHLARDAGMRGIVLKNHYTMTADRAQLLMREAGNLEVFGGIVLNHSVGGINVDAVRRMVEMKGSRGKIVWLPTIDAENQVRFAQEERSFVQVVRDEKPVPELDAVFNLIAQYDLVLATGHSSVDESIILINAAKHAGVQRFLVTHVLAEAMQSTPGKLQRLADLGAMLECTWLTHSPGTGGAINVGNPIPVADCARVIRKIGAEHFVISSDYGQWNNPVHTDGLQAFVVALRAEGVSTDEVELLIRRNPARLLGLED